MATTNIATSVLQNLDIKSLVTSLVNAEKKPIQQMQAEKTSTKTKLSEFGTIQSLREKASEANKKVKTAIEDGLTNEQLVSAIQNQIKELNSYYTKLKSSTDVKATLANDSAARSIKNTVRQAISTELYTDNVTTGFLKTNKNGTIELNETALMTALSDSSVKDRLLSISNNMANVLDDSGYSDTLIDSRVDALNAKSAGIDRRIDNYNKYLDQRSNILTVQFTALQTALSNYSTTAASASSFNFNINNNS
jgi:flagellar capping protein FliD